MPQTGRYKVYGTWNSGSSRASNAKYTINAGPNQHTSIQNQRLNGGQWNLLGEYTFDIADNPNGQNNVSLSSEANGYLIADAIKLELIEDNQPTPSGLFFIHNDHLGTPKRLTDTQGQVVWSLQTTPFGEIHEEIANGIALLNGFPGQYRDSETGLSYNYYRDYDPSIGRYIESDPIGLGGGLNTYGYVGGNPLSYYDPLGLAQFGFRPLGDGNTILDPNKVPSGNSNIHKVHEQLWWDDNPNENTGFFAGDGGGRGWGMCGEEGDVRSDVGHDRQQYSFFGPTYDDDLMRQAPDNISNDWNDRGYCLIGQNCQDFADALRDEYDQLLNSTPLPVE